MTGRPNGATNDILPRDNSMAPSLVLFDIDKDREHDNEDPSAAPDKSLHTTSQNLLGYNNTSANDLSMINGTDNQLLGEIRVRSDQEP
jgi:hypothetical protein